MSEQVQELRELMVIHKARNTKWVISTKSLLIFTITWALWLLTVYLIVDDHRTLFYSPIIGPWTLVDLAKAALAIVLVQLNLLLLWSIFISYKQRR